MPILKKFCFCFSLRTGALIIAYSSLFIDITDGVWTMYNKEKFCFKILIIMIISSIWNVVSDMILITAIYRQNPNLLPVHLVTCLGSLILRLICNMLTAVVTEPDYLMVAYAFFMIGYIAADVLIVLSYYHSEV
ncbi:uncharacterized protein LOC108138076 isoform X1 [Drosophila elegans]|uniref:uncharacterized protein LOC108138076 isoform X1 n=1 Tax=Drosophila elegans TaxID=30023 RepID=UPI0007E7F1DD|nr:uncharacterized protein LOC108138076 isoform X1 [Drosophila elegans]XP_017115542.1 uncharacterized protein LOC108138076 isoform X1 [Drosophila elegans]